MGERTAGAVVAGCPFLLSDGSLLFLAVLDVFVDGEHLEGKGVAPDVAVPADLNPTRRSATRSSTWRQGSSAADDGQYPSTSTPTCLS